MRFARVEALLFAIATIAFAYFHQGGGWNQNTRFAMVRAMVEERRFSIDDYLVYRVPRGEDPTLRLERLPVRAGEVSIEEKAHGLVWDITPSGMQRVDGRAFGTAPVLAVSEWAASGDLAYHGGHFYPNKAPGTSFLAFPGYFAIYHLERLIGADPDTWWTLTLNSWLTSILSVGLLSALGCVLFYRSAVLLWGEDPLPIALATLTLASGTMFFSYATMMFEHNIVAVMLLAAFYLLFQAKRASDRSSSRRTSPLVEDAAARDRIPARIVLAGFCAGFAAITNYMMAVVVVLLAFYLVLGVRRRHAWLGFGLGVLLPFLLVCAYNFTCFGTPFTTNYRYQNPMFASSGMFLGVFVAPDPTALLAILFSPFRGLFFTSPVLLVALPGFVRLFRDGKHRAEGWLIGSVVAFLLLFNICFYDWEGGFGVGPRYLTPALPFLVLPLVFGFQRYRKTTSALALISVAATLVCTAVDPQCPVAAVQNRPQWMFNPLVEYELPLLLTGRPGPILRAMMNSALEQQDRDLASRGIAPAERAARIASSRRNAEISMARDDGGGLSLATFRGPVSVNPQGAYEGSYYHLFPPGSVQSEWNSFNAGEFVFPKSPLSLLPLGLVCSALLVVTLRRAARTGPT